MNKKQQELFRAKLLDLLSETESAIKMANQRDREISVPRGGDEADMADRIVNAATAAAQSNRLHSYRKEILAALGRIESGNYGYCEETGDEIGLERLKANPVARYSIETQERIERMKRLHAS